ncbi:MULTISPECIES: SDR family oxidoreductase [Paenibacillus]|uniref:SDR family oxidoreductase n=1 Tax=Paenibacillus TaxID=44249 RepID=UPI0007BF4194|nr:MULTISPECIES: SDR family oxidoreductase [Paenibacillus]MCZ1267841.1 SDR family oxidoreductase [Paenibacillus tundrae]WDQ31967.1 SDR family oxidoreductase [Paenibacillus marchantiae]SLJ92591.1 3-oxoacyl-[acyl-carrier protein] reductase [Paenibacillus sp. RU5A]SOC58561.1 3-oxoacyl-[acyl-carrier protein] reductase [Paenibacillus sp. RU26A]SOC67613.1 3-oxoacyl-[acyl-carrier protein] reductase [Paenibacillus sp. RU5M]
MKKLAGKVAIVTGSSRGIGRAIAEQLAELGADVVINYASSPDKAEQVADIARQKGVRAITVQADLARKEDVERLFSETISQLGKVDILINNAGIMKTTPLADVTEEEFDQQFAINVKGTFFACQQALKHMEEQGRIVNFSTSVTGQMFPGYSVYAGTKGAVEQITRQLAKEFGSRQITINAVAPGPVNTELFSVGKTEQQLEGLRKMNAFGRLGEPEDIANVISFLVSEESQWVTGQTLRANGGFI